MTKLYRGARTPEADEKGKNRLLTRAAQNRDCVFAGAYRAATVRESVAEYFFSNLTPACRVRTHANARLPDPT
jgi:hypothetical protein